MGTALHRNLQAMADADYDLVVIGAGINGVACAREAALRGLRVAIVDRGDFGAITSANSSKIAHSGVRYLQHLDFKRMRESVRERNNLIHNAPHLINAQPVLLPTYGHGIKGRETTSIYVKIYDLLSPDRKWFEDPARNIANSRMVSAARVREIAPGIRVDGLSGGAIWPESQMHNTERLLLATLRSAVGLGAAVANYAAVERILLDGDRVCGVALRDVIGGASLSLRTRAVINATGPWVNKTLAACGIPCGDHGIHGSKAISLLTRQLDPTYVLSFPIRPMYEDKKALLNKGSSIMFAIPWRDCSLIGSLHLPCDDDPDRVGVSDEEIERYMALINEGYPAARLRREDVRNVLWGIVPAEGPGSAAPLKHYRLIDHQRDDGVAGLSSVVGVKFTTHRDVAQKAVDLVFRQWGQSPPPSPSARSPVWGGDIHLIEAYREAILRDHAGLLPPECLERLVAHYGRGCEAILALIAAEPELAQRLPGSPVTRAEVAYAIREEMALSLTDVVKRRTDLGSLEHPPEAALAACADLMAAELGWDAQRVAAEREALRKSYLWLPGGR